MVGKDKKCSTLYKTQLLLEKNKINTVEENSMNLWHEGLRHMSKKGL